MNLRTFFAALAAATLVFTGAATANAQAPGGKPPSEAEQVAMAKKSLQTRFGLSETQATAAIKKMKAVSEVYKPKMAALRTKYGANPTPAKQAEAQKEAMGMMSSITADMEKALLSVATPAQRTKIKAELNKAKAGKPQ